MLTGWTWGYQKQNNHTTVWYDTENKMWPVGKLNFFTCLVTRCSKYKTGLKLEVSIFRSICCPLWNGIKLNIDHTEGIQGWILHQLFHSEMQALKHVQKKSNGFLISHEKNRLKKVSSSLFVVVEIVSRGDPRLRSRLRFTVFGVTRVCHRVQLLLICPFWI